MVRVGFTLRDAMALSAMGLGAAVLLLPLGLQAREAARGASCEQRLATVARGVLSFANANNGALPSNRRQPFTSWNTLVLPYAERQAMFDRYDLAEDWWKPANQAVGAVHLPELVCPSAPHGKRRIRLLDPDGRPFDAAATDFVASAGAYRFRNKPEQLFRGALASPGRYYGASQVTAGRTVKLSEITDGRANSLLLVEMADKPNQWRAGKRLVSEDDEGTPRPLVEGFSFGQWVAPNWNHLRAYSADGSKPFGRCAVNCSNAGSIYSFHDGFANAAFADGSVRRLRAGLDEEVLVALVSIADGELLVRTDYEAE